MTQSMTHKNPANQFIYRDAGRALVFAFEYKQVMIQKNTSLHVMLVMNSRNPILKPENR